MDLEKKLAVEFASVASYRFSLVRSLAPIGRASRSLATAGRKRGRASKKKSPTWTKIQESSPQMLALRTACSAASYALLAKVLREMGENSLADAAAAKAEEAGFHRGPPPTAIFTATGSGRRHRSSPRGRGPLPGVRRLLR